MKLSNDQIDEATARLVERHPLGYSKLPLSEIFPILKCWQKRPELSEDKLEEIEKNLKVEDSEMKPKEQENSSFIDSDIERSDDVKHGNREYERYQKIKTHQLKAQKGFLTLGYGYVAYFSFLEFMILLFTILTVLSLPFMYYYATFQNVQDDSVSFNSSVQMGNLGYSSALGRDVHLGVGVLTLSGDTGSIRDVVAFGIIPEHAKISDACLPNEETEAGDDALNESNIIDVIENECLEKDIGTIDIAPLLNKNYTQNKKGTSEDARFFAQVFGKARNDQEISDKKRVQLVLVWLTIVTAAIYYLGLEFMDRYSEAKLEDYDQETTTTSDFTAIYRIPEPLFENFRSNVYPELKEYLFKKEQKVYPVISAFKVFLVDGIERALSDQPQPEPNVHKHSFITEEIKKEPINKVEDLIIKEEKISEESEEVDSFGASSEKDEEDPKESPPLNRISTFSPVQEQKVSYKKFPTERPDKVSGKKFKKMFGFQRSVTNITEKVSFKSLSNKLSKIAERKSTLKEYFSDRTKDFRIADVYFSFKNRDVLNLLKDRGEAILNNNDALKVDIEKQIIDVIKEKYDELITPVSAFITFGNEESYLKATDLNKVRVMSKEYYK